MITGAAVALVWFWIPLSIVVIGISSIPSGIGFALAVVVFIYLMRGVEWVERMRSEAVFGLGARSGTLSADGERSDCAHGCASALSRRRTTGRPRKGIG